MSFAHRCRCGALFGLMFIVGALSVIFLSETDIEAPLIFFWSMMTVIIIYGTWHTWHLIRHWHRRSCERCNWRSLGLFRGKQPDAR